MPGTIEILHIADNLDISDPFDVIWDETAGVAASRYWSGEEAPKGRHFSAKLLWSDSALYVRFEANQNEPLIVSAEPNVSSKTVGLWERDVCEIFIAPDKGEPRKYFEFEIAPTGEWLDLAIDSTTGTRQTDFEYRSGMSAAAAILSDRVIGIIRIPFTAFGKTPKAGDVWLGNLFRCVGAGQSRGYLAWQPILTDIPNFHVPEKFGQLRFVD